MRRRRLAMWAVVFLAVAAVAGCAPARQMLGPRSEAPRLADGLFVTSQLDSFAERDAMSAFHELERAAWITRTWGDCYGYLLVATGRAAAMVDPIANSWDVAAVQPVMQETGGTFTDWRGERTIFGGEGVATNAAVLEEVLAVLRPFGRK